MLQLAVDLGQHPAGGLELCVPAKTSSLIRKENYEKFACYEAVTLGISHRLLKVRKRNNGG